VTHPIPSGTRDVLPDEMRDCARSPARARGVDDAGYGEVYTRRSSTTPRSSAPTWPGARPAYRLSTSTATWWCCVRHDRADRAASSLPLRAVRAAPAVLLPPHAYRGVRPQRGQVREILQAGIELIGSPRRRHRRGRSACSAGARRRRMRDYRVGLGDASLTARLLDAFAVPARRGSASCTSLSLAISRLERGVAAAGIAMTRPPCCCACRKRGGADVLDGGTGRRRGLADAGRP